MPVLLKIELVALAFLFIVVVFYAVNRKKLQMRHSLLWLFLSFALLLAALFPGAVVWLSDLVGIQVPSNFIYLMGIFFLLILCFSLTVNLSRQAERSTRTVQIVSIERYLREEERRAASPAGEPKISEEEREKRA